MRYQRPSIFLLLMMFITAGCSTTRLTSPATAISLLIPVEAGQFSKQAVVRIRLLNSTQLAIDENNPICIIVHNAGSNTESTECPPGKEYKIVTPEDFAFPIADVGSQIKITSSTLKMGEKFRIFVSGLSTDDCNGRSTDFTGLADSEIILLKDLLWSTTAMACIKNP